MAENSDDDKIIRQANARELQKKRNLQYRPSLTRGDMDDPYTIFRPYNTPRGRTAEPNDFCFRCGSKCHFRRDCRLVSNLGVQESKLKKKKESRLSKNQCSGGHGRFLSHRQGLYLSHRQEVQETQQPEVKYNFSSHDPDVVITVSKFEYQEQSNNDINVKGRLRLHLDFWKSIGTYENTIDTIYNGYRIPFIETPSPKISKITSLLFKIC